MKKKELFIKETLTVRFDDKPSDSTINIVSLTGHLDTYNSHEFQKEMINLINNGFKNFVFDMEELDYVSSTGVGVFAKIERELSENGTVVLSNMQLKVYDVFKTLGFVNFYKITKSVDDAKKLINRKK